MNVSLRLYQLSSLCGYTAGRSEKFVTGQVVITIN